MLLGLIYAFSWGFREMEVVRGWWDLDGQGYFHCAYLCHFAIVHTHPLKTGGSVLATRLSRKGTFAVFTCSCVADDAFARG